MLSLLVVRIGTAAPVSFLSSTQAVFAPPTRLPPCTPGSSFQPAVGRFGFLPPPPLETSDGLHGLPETPGNGGCLAPIDSRDFSPGPNYDCRPYSVCEELGIYGDKRLVPTQRPLVELGVPFYDTGPVPESKTWCGPTNLVQPKLYVYGDYRVAYAQNTNIAQEADVLAHRLNLEVDYWITSTERLHAFVGPFQDAGKFMRVENGKYIEELELFNDNTDTLFFEGDLGQMLGGWEHTQAPFDLPFTAGLVPLLLQNGVWALDTAWGAAVTIPARNSPRFDWSNFDVTFFAALDQVSSDAFDQAPHSGQFYGATAFIESRGGYLEVGYAFVDDRHGVGRGYHNVGVSYTRRYLNRVSNSVRLIVNAGQDLPKADRTADGVLLLVENSFLTKHPYTVVPYVNFWAGFDRPQPLARAAAFGGVLFNTGILFQVDGLTGFPTLDATANNTTGAAVGVDLLGEAFDQQLIAEAAVLHAFGDDATRNAPGNQYGVGVRWQLPLDEARLIRVDAMHGFTEDARDIMGVRVEYRWKF
ncbi:MAG: hypothetical protein AAGB00_03855 [Planctomycetota bacterium]